VEYTEEELQSELSDLDFLRDAFLIILNEGAVSDFDAPYTKSEVLEYAEEMYMDSKYSKEYIRKCFNK